MGDVRLETFRASEANTAVNLHPAWTLSARRELRASRHRAAGGRLFSYTWGSYAAYRVPLAFVPADVRTLLHDLWRVREPVLFTLDSSLEHSRTLCGIVSDRAPLDARVPGLARHWAGELALEARDARTGLGRAFILDDPAQGRLDQPQQALI